MKSEKQIIKDVLTDFLSADVSNDESYEDGFLGAVLDEDEISILTNALVEALESNRNESQN